MISEFFDELLNKYITWELLPAYLVAGAVCIGAWVLTTPFRDVVWVYLVEVLRVICLHGSMWAVFLSRYQEVHQEGALRQMRVRVRDSRTEDFGCYGEMARTWWFALHATLYVYMPDLLIRTSASTAKNYDAFLDATAATIHIPMAAYDLLEFVLQGGLGVAVVVLVLNLLNVYLEWTEYGLLIVDLDGRLEMLSPGSVLTDTRSSVKSSATARKHQECASLHRLRQSEPEVVVLLRDEDDMDSDSGYETTNDVASTERTTTQPSSPQQLRPVTLKTKEREASAEDDRLEVGEYVPSQGGQASCQGQCWCSCLGSLLLYRVPYRWVPVWIPPVWAT
ncbi:hypothetical protein JG688_00017828 [Phytophthora aleatoria]|uniref:Uncharacterized protein n=1 Tax=Phytophthora aleatoria TaxID=2496075 RepID=A0A8J5I0B7_9STRA|nr:hypothetical protein JG688_00017828 [Phytophthora aleatoria]